MLLPLSISSGGFLNVSSSAPASTSARVAGIAYDSTGAVHVDLSSAIADHNGGLPVTATGALAVELGGTPDHAINGIQITSAGRVVVSEQSAVSGATAGIPITSSGAISVYGVAPWSFSEVLDYYDARYGITEVTGVSAWAPTLNGTHTLEQSTGANQPAWTDGDSILFDGTNDYLQDLYTLAQPYMVFIVFKNITFTDNEHIFAGGDANVGVMVQRTATPNLALFNEAYSNSVAGAADGTYMIAWGLFDGADSLIGVNLGTAGTGAGLSANGCGGLTVGSIPAGAAFANIQVKAIAVTQEMDATRRAEFIRAMNAVYGVF